MFDQNEFEKLRQQKQEAELPANIKRDRDILFASVMLLEHLSRLSLPVIFRMISTGSGEAKEVNAAVCTLVGVIAIFIHETNLSAILNKALDELEKPINPDLN
jgi:hypothetical protein